jgi:putative restriction endonuclease
MSSRRIFGHVPGYREGYEFSSRIDLSASGVHAPRQAGISGSQREGADSIVLSGKYEDDEDHGDLLIYTGHGGRDPESGKQVTDQELVRNNLALALSCQQGLPVRVIRGGDPANPFAPDEGYRYDGLFRVEDYWRETGKSGHTVWRFRLRKIAPEPDGGASGFAEEAGGYWPAKRVLATISRIVRDTERSREVKELYRYACQVCGTTIQTTAGPYAEAAHIRPLGAPHDGPDVVENILCLCPNHHVMFDYGGFSVHENFSLAGIPGILRVHPRHAVGKAFLRYHFEHFYQQEQK